MGLILTTAPAIEPLTIAEVSAQLRLGAGSLEGDLPFWLPREDAPDRCQERLGNTYDSGEEAELAKNSAKVCCRCGSF